MTEEALGDNSVTAPAPRRPRPRGRFRAVRMLRRDERGTALVEFALVLFPLCLILFGIIDFARALNYYNDLTQIAGQGARAAAVNADPNGGPADNNFQHQLACASSTGELRKGISVNITATPTKVGDPVSVKTSYTFTFIPVLKLAQLPLSVTQTERYESGSAPTYSSANDVTNGSGTGTCP